MLRRALAWLLPLVCATAWAAPGAAQSFPKFTGYVVDAANVLPPDAEAQLTAKLDALFRDTKRQLVVATVPDLQGYPIEDYGYRLGRAWGVGLRDVNNGAILLVAPNERKVRVEVGYGLEPVLTDAFSGRVIAEQIVPRFRAGDLPGGVSAGTDALVAQLRAAPDEAKARTDAAAAAYERERRTRTQGSGGGVPVSLLFWGVILFFFVLPALFGGGRRRGRRYRGGGGGAWPIVLWSVANELNRGSRGGWGGGWGGGGFGGGGGWGGGGGFGGGGGGSFGGGGASGSW